MSMLNAVRVGYGFARLIRPEPLAGPPAAADYGVRAHTVDRLLGARQLVQAVVSQAVPTERVLVLGAAVDLLHAASMLAVAGVSGPRRRAALAESVAALGFATAGVVAARWAQPPPTDDRSRTE